jgi:hypothetical protein
MGWAMFFLFFALKVPLLALCWLVWWAVKQVPEDEEQPGGGGGAKRQPHPHPPFPHLPRRGPHGDPAPPSPPRVRPVTARARELTERTSSARTGER